MYDEVQVGIEANALFATKLQQEEREEYTIEEREKFSAKTIASQRRFRAAQRFAEIRSLYERQKRVIDDFKPMDSDDTVEKEKILKEPDSTKVKVKQEGDEESIRKRPGTFSEMITRFDRIDLEELYNLLMQRFETISPEGVDLVLWGDLRTMFEETTNDDLWKNQEE
nr:hypothetical protein [Tanacetum cinerariifolium]